MNYETSASGKWILAGEHSVLRGCPALVFPLSGKTLKLTYEKPKDIFFAKKNEPLSVTLAGEHGEELRLLFWGVLERALEILKVPRHQITGHITLNNGLPIGAGLGASATLCVVIARWLNHLKYIREEEVYEFARQLENLFHGESSGVDIAVALSGQGLHFVRGGERYPVTKKWSPQWYVSFSGKRGVTSECVGKVKALFNTDEELAQSIDDDMKKSVQLCEQALQMSEEEGFTKLAHAIRLASTCFERWGLDGGPVKQHMHALQEAGAIAVKPTGSGDGGYVLSLWKTPPPESLRAKLIPC